MVDEIFHLTLSHIKSKYYKPNPSLTFRTIRMIVV